MKKISYLLFVFYFNWVSAQNVVISESESAPDASAILDIQSESKGILIPKVVLSSVNEPDPIPDPATGLLVFSEGGDVPDGFYYWMGTKWNFFLTQAGSPVPSGTIMAYGGSSIPDGWLACDGESYSQTEYAELFAAIETNWGGSGGNFNVPDFRGYFLRGADLGAGNDPDASARAGMSGGNTGDTIGSYQEDELESHNHEIRAGHTVELNLLTSSSKNKVAPSGSSLQSVSATHVASTGGSETRPKNAYVNYIIKY